MRKRTAVALLPAAALIACGGGGDPAPGPVADIPAVDPMEIVVSNVGRPPRQPLTTRLVAGEQWDADLAFEYTDGPNSLAVEGPTQLAVDEVRPDGSAVVRAAIDGLDVSIRPTPELDVADAVRAQGRLVVGPDRSVERAALDFEFAEALGEGRDRVGDIDVRLPWFLFPVPDRPVGEGAIWELRGPVVLFGLPFDFTAVVRLGDLDADAYRLGLAAFLTGPDVPGGLPLRLQGTGGVEGDLTDLVPAQASIHFEGGSRRLELTIESP